MSSTDLMALERQEQIAEQVNKVGRTTVAELSAQFNVSEATIRRDLLSLAQRGLVRRTHGGVMRIGRVLSTEIPIMQRQGVRIEEKERIGAAAVSLIGNDETLFIAGGSTALAMVRNLTEHRNLTIITDSLLVTQELLRQERHRCMILGGTIERDEQAVRGTVARQMLEQFHVDKVILGVRAISVERGISMETPEEAEFFGTAMKSGNHIIMVTDSSKFNLSAFVHLAPITAIDTLITDSDLDTSLAQQIRDFNIELILA